MSNWHLNIQMTHSSCLDRWTEWNAGKLQGPEISLSLILRELGQGIGSCWLWTRFFPTTLRLRVHDTPFLKWHHWRKGWETPIVAKELLMALCSLVPQGHALLWLEVSVPHVRCWGPITYFSFHPGGSLEEQDIEFPSFQFGQPW